MFEFMFDYLFSFISIVPAIVPIRGAIVVLATVITSHLTECGRIDLELINIIIAIAKTLPLIHHHIVHEVIAGTFHHRCHLELTIIFVHNFDLMLRTNTLNYVTTHTYNSILLISVISSTCSILSWRLKIELCASSRMESIYCCIHAYFLLISDTSFCCHEIKIVFVWTIS